MTATITRVLPRAGPAEPAQHAGQPLRCRHCRQPITGWPLFIDVPPVAGIYCVPRCFLVVLRACWTRQGMPAEKQP